MGRETEIIFPDAGGAPLYPDPGARGPVLVTGAAGFLGRALVAELLRHGYAVRGLCRRDGQAEALRALGAKPVRGDLLDPPSLAAAVEGAEVVFHLAAALRGGARVYDRVNRGGTRDLAAAAAAAPALRRFVLVSSRAATGASRDGRPVSAATPPRPAYDYGVSKLEAERELARVPGLAWCAVRPPLLYGPGDRLTLPLFRLAARGLYPQFAGGLRYLSMVHVTDAARAVRLAGEAPGIEGRAIHLTGPEPVTPAALGDALERAAGRKLHRLRVPAPLVALLAEAMEPIARAIGAARTRLAPPGRGRNGGPRRDWLPISRAPRRGSGGGDGGLPPGRPRQPQQQPEVISSTRVTLAGATFARLKRAVTSFFPGASQTQTVWPVFGSM